MNQRHYRGESQQNTLTKREHRTYLQEFIDIYRQKEPLWNTKHPHYANTHTRNMCYDELVEKMKEVLPNSTREDVVKKINTIRSSFRKEYRKVCHANVLLDRSYKPKLWYYDNLLFLVRRGPPPGTHVERHLSTDEVESDQTEQCEQADDITYTRSAKFETSTTVRRRRKPSKAEAHADIFGRHVAAKLSMVPPDQRVFLEKLINDAIFEAELGNLGRDSRIILD